MEESSVAEEVCFTQVHIFLALLTGFGGGMLAGLLAGRRKRRAVLLYAPEGFELTRAPPELVDLMLWRTRKVVSGV